MQYKHAKINMLDKHANINMKDKHANLVMNDKHAKISIEPASPLLENIVAPFKYLSNIFIQLKNFIIQPLLDFI